MAGKICNVRGRLQGDYGPLINQSESVYYRSRIINGSNAEICSDVAGPSSSSSGDLFELLDRSNQTIILLVPHY